MTTLTVGALRALLASYPDDDELTVGGFDTDDGTAVLSVGPYRDGRELGLVTFDDDR